MDRGVYYRNDLMNDWAWLGGGLPNVVISELEFLPRGEHGTPEIYAATFGRGVWKTDAISDETVSSGYSGAVALQTSLFPSPNDGRFNVALSLTGEKLTVCTILIVDVHGRTVYLENQQPGEREYQHQVRLDVPAGLYYANIRTENGSSTIPFLVIR